MGGYKSAHKCRKKVSQKASSGYFCWLAQVWSVKHFSSCNQCIKHCFFLSPPSSTVVLKCGGRFKILCMANRNIIQSDQTWAADCGIQVQAQRCLNMFLGGYISFRDVSYCFRMVWYRKIESVLCLFCFTQEKTWRIPFTSHQLAAQFSAMDSTALCIVVLPQRI